MSPIGGLSFSSNAVFAAGIIFGGHVLKDTAVAAVGISAKAAAFVLDDIINYHGNHNPPTTIKELNDKHTMKNLVKDLNDFGDDYINSAKESMPINLVGAAVSMLGIFFIANQASQMPGSLINGTNSINATLWNSTTNATI